MKDLKLFAVTTDCIMRYRVDYVFAVDIDDLHELLPNVDWADQETRVEMHEIKRGIVDYVYLQEG